MPKKVFLLADGAPLPRSARDRLRRGRYTIVLDGAAEQARKERWLPQLIAGDFDTVSRGTLDHFAKKGVTLLHTPDQNHTDLEKALAWCVSQGSSSIWVAQATGNRLDHTLANLSFLKRFHAPERELIYFTGRERLRFLRDQSHRSRVGKGRGIALLPFPRCRASSRGLAFEMNGLELELGLKESVSNRALKAEVLVEVEGEALLIEEIKT
jgi:thiamine pyrophosphokinase